MKVLLWILGIISVVLALLIGGGVFLYHQFMDGAQAQIELGEQVGSQGTFEDCVLGVAEQANQCDSFGCIIDTTAFVSSCAEATNNFDFCGKIQTLDQQNKFTQQACEGAGALELCQEVVSLVYEMCPAS
ncbi:hypothetical protein [Salinibius halmophilus]|uniref:hypothetical protein n=1 Tax=Salinibius halmophilus TaxID=1853216 RepID=UPI000E666376|nr:hypothetical protein [Salinibius halmophilus]